MKKKLSELLKFHVISMKFQVHLYKIYCLKIYKEINEML